MIPKNVRPGASAEGLEGERASFQIEANGKAFRTLIDGLYSNKVRAVIRELCSNALDSHIEAGQTRPVDVSIPTHLDPVFRVRDYGVSLSHDNMMVLYTTIFKSTKETTNAQTGQLGLGSKSPFAYTDTFSVIAYKDGVRRVYVAFLETDGVPCITHVGDEPSDEPQGLEVSFPAKRADMGEFQVEMHYVALGYKPGTLNVSGMTIKTADPVMSGKSWAMYRSGEYGNSHNTNYVRMGTVVYPLPQSMGMGNIDQYRYTVVVEIPIGAAEVTASRESISMDDDTRQAIRGVMFEADREAVEQVKALMAAYGPSRIQQALAYEKYGQILRSGIQGSSEVSLLSPGVQNLHVDSKRTPGDVLEKATMYGKAESRRSYGTQRYVTKFHVNYLKDVTVVLDDTSQKLVRRFKRIQNFAKSKSNVLVFSSADPKEIAQARKWITECWELKPEQFMLSSNVPDCPPPKRPSGPRSAPRMLKPGQFWMSRRDGRVVSDIYGTSDRGTDEWGARLVAAARVAGISLDWEEIFWVNERDETKWTALGKLPMARKLDVVIEKRVKEFLAKQPLDQAQTLTQVTEQVGRYNRALDVVLEQFFPEVKITQTEAAQILKVAEIANVDLRNSLIADTVKVRVRQLADEYPLLFDKSDRKHFEHYVQAVKANKS